MKLEWKVIRENFNSKEINFYNVFDHGSFYYDFIKLCKRRLNKDRFLEEVKSDLRYYFWGKCEHEVIVSAWPPREGVEEKIDVFDQVMANWEHFAEYCTKVRPDVRRMKDEEED